MFEKYPTKFEVLEYIYNSTDHVHLKGNYHPAIITIEEVSEHYNFPNCNTFRIYIHDYLDKYINIDNFNNMYVTDEGEALIIETNVLNQNKKIEFKRKLLTSSIFDAIIALIVALLTTLLTLWLNSMG